MIRKICFPSIVFGGLFMLSVTPAQAFQIMKGKWEVRVEIQNPMSAQADVQTKIECIEETSFDPVKEMTKDGQCTIVDKKETDKSLSWTMECGGADMPVMQGKGLFTSDGKTASGKMEMTMTFNGQTMTLGNSWEGRHLSKECD